MTPFFRLRLSSAEKEGKSASMTDCFKRKVRHVNPHPSPLPKGRGRIIKENSTASPQPSVLDLLHAHRVSPFVLLCRLVHLRIILLSTLLTFVTKSFGLLSLTTELETLRARSPFGLDSALQKIRLPGLTPFGRVVRP